MAQDERTLNMDLPDAVVLAAKGGNADAVRDWLAAGGAPDAIRPNGNSLLACACMSARPSCASVVEILCEAGARGHGLCLGFAAMYGAVHTVRVLLRYGAPASATFTNGSTALHFAVMTNEWRLYQDPWSRARAQAAAASRRGDARRGDERQDDLVVLRELKEQLQIARGEGYVREVSALDVDERERCKSLVDAYVARGVSEGMLHDIKVNHFDRDAGGTSVSKPEMCRRIGAVALIDDSIDYARQCADAGLPVFLFGEHARSLAPIRAHRARVGVRVQRGALNRLIRRLVVHGARDAVARAVDDGAPLHRADKVEPGRLLRQPQGADAVGILRPRRRVSRRLGRPLVQRDAPAVVLEGKLRLLSSRRLECLRQLLAERRHALQLASVAKPFARGHRGERRAAAEGVLRHAALEAVAEQQRLVAVVAAARAADGLVSPGWTCG